MERVTGIGGVFFRARNPERLRAWYAEHLGVELRRFGGAVFSAAAGDTESEHGRFGWATDPEGNRRALAATGR
jgi:hypothetical protein